MLRAVLVAACAVAMCPLEDLFGEESVSLLQLKGGCSSLAPGPSVPARSLFGMERKVRKNGCCYESGPKECRSLSIWIACV